MMLSVKEVSKRLGLSRTLVYREIRQGRLVHHCFGQRAIRVSVDDLDAYIKSRRDDSPKYFPESKPREKRLASSQFRHLNVNRIISRRK